MYFAGIAVAAAGTVLFAKLRPVEATFVALVHAQSIPPRASAAGTMPPTLGAKLKVKPSRVVGIPFPAVAATATEMTQLVAAAGKAAQFAAGGEPPAAALNTQ